MIRKGPTTPKSQLSPSGSIRSNISNVSNGAKSLVIGSDELGASLNPVGNSLISPNDISNHHDKLLEAEEEVFDDNEKAFDDDDENYFFKEESDIDDIKEESVAMDLDYDHLMAYFDSLKESNA